MTIIEKEVGFCGLPRADALAMTIIKKALAMTSGIFISHCEEWNDEAVYKWIATERCSSQ